MLSRAEKKLPGYPVDEVAEASRYVEIGQKTGNVVLTVASDR
ncbi:MAG: hypothetical protein ABIQ05_03975 [Candidatus Limnocylindria bacterium]